MLVRRLNKRTDVVRVRAAGRESQLWFRKHMDTNYGTRDSAYYSVIDEEWPEVRANLTRRLAERTR